MAIANLVPRTALVVIDLKQGIIAYLAVHPIAAVLARASELAGAVGRHRLPVLVNVEGSAPGRTEQPRRAVDLPADCRELVSERERQPDDTALTKPRWAPWRAPTWNHARKSVVSSRS
jgi:hypothetical protein